MTTAQAASDLAGRPAGGVPVLELDGVSKVYPGSPPVRALDQASLAVAARELVAVAGPSGSGKSTLLHLMGTLDKPTAGTVRITGLEEARLIESMQKIANRISIGVITAGLIMGAALMMRVPTRSLLFGYPALALVLFLLAFALGASLVISSLLNDRRTKPREERDPI